MAKYIFPDETSLIRYLALLRRVLLDARLRTYETDPQTAELLDAVENVPDLLARWPDMKEDLVIEDLKRYEAKYLETDAQYTRILCEGPPSHWQTRVDDEIAPG
jgi:hypothetical protein